MKETGTSPPLPDETRTWLDDHPDIAREPLERVWRLVGLAWPERPLDEQRLSRIRAQILSRAEASQHDPEKQDRQPVRIRRHRRLFMWMALSIGAAVLLMFVAFLATRPTVLTVPNGERLATTLPDGSEVILNSGSTLRVQPFWLPGARKVDLEGEAFFAVTPGRSFILRTFNASVQVLGTRFGVRAWPTEIATVVILEEGAVRLVPATSPDRSVLLRPRQRASTDPDGVTGPEDISTDQLLAWRSGGFAYDDEPLGRVLDDIERRLGTKILVSVPGAEQSRISLYLNATQDPDKVLQLISMVKGYNYRKTEYGYELLP